MVRNWELQDKAGKLKETGCLPLIIPIVFYHGTKAWGYDFQFIDLFGNDMPDEMKAYVPNFQHLMCDFSDIPDEAIKGRVIIQVAMSLLKHISDQDFAQKIPNILTLLEDLSNQSTGLEYLYTVLLYLNNAADIDKDELTTIVRKTLPNLGEDIMATPAEQWRNEGRLEGQLEAKKEILVKLSTLRFGKLDELVTKKIEMATLEQLTQWSERILLAKTMDEIFQ